MKFCVGIVFICGSWVFFTSLLLGGGFQVLTNNRPHSPHQLDRQPVKEIQLHVGIDRHQPVWLGHLRSNFGKVLGSRHTD
jgi:hypothetical protein